jgi:hypothetical protein
MNGTAGILLLLLALAAVMLITTPKGRDALDVALGRKRAVDQ